MMLGREVTLPMLAVIGEPVKENVAKRMHADDYIEELQEKMKQAHKLARKYLKQNAIYQKRHYDLKAKERSFKVGQPVWLHDPVRKVGVCQKMTSPWKGPYLITRKIDDITYMVKKFQKQPAKAYHIDRLMLYRGQHLPRWISDWSKRLKEL
jgi:predicted transcriptional regulator